VQAAPFPGLEFEGWSNGPTLCEKDSKCSCLWLTSLWHHGKCVLPTCPMSKCLEYIYPLTSPTCVCLQRDPASAKLLDELKAEGLFIQTYAYEPPVHSQLPEDLQNKSVISSPIVYSSPFVILYTADGGSPRGFVRGDCINLGEQVIFIGALQVCEAQYDELPVSSVWEIVPPNMKSRLQQADPIAVFWDPTTGLHIRVSAS
jgi:hypothetical protein